MRKVEVYLQSCTYNMCTAKRQGKQNTVDRMRGRDQKDWEEESSFLCLTETNTKT